MKWKLFFPVEFATVWCCACLHFYFQFHIKSNNNNIYSNKNYLIDLITPPLDPPPPTVDIVYCASKLLYSFSPFALCLYCDYILYFCLSVSVLLFPVNDELCEWGNN